MQNYKTAIGMALFFAAAGLERNPQNYINLDWMIPAPAQEQCLLSPCRKIRLQ
jgi:hypothetical protein